MEFRLETLWPTSRRPRTALHGHLGLVPEDASFDPRRTAREVLAFHAKRRRVDAENARFHIDSLTTDALTTAKAQFRRHDRCRSSTPVSAICSTRLR